MTTEEKIIKNKLGLIKLARTLGSVSQAWQGNGLFPGQLLPLQGAI